MLFTIGKQIRQARKSHNISQAEPAKTIGMSRTAIGQIKNGTVREIGGRKLIRALEFPGLELRVRVAGSRPTLEEFREIGERIMAVWDEGVKDLPGWHETPLILFVTQLEFTMQFCN